MSDRFASSNLIGWEQLEDSLISLVHTWQHLQSAGVLPENVEMGSQMGMGLGAMIRGGLPKL